MDEGMRESMTYADAIQYLYGFQPFGACFGLERIRRGMKPEYMALLVSSLWFLVL